MMIGGQMRIRLAAIFGIVAAFLLWAHAASALSAPVLSYTTHGSTPPIGDAHVVSYELFGSYESAYALAFEASLEGLTGVSFCGDLLNYISLNGNYDATVVDYASLAPGYSAAAAIANDWSLHLSGLAGDLAVSLADAAAGVQLAIWETIYGDDFLAKMATTGTFEVMNYVLAQTYDGPGNTVFLDNQKWGHAKQDHFFTAGVPEPTAALLFGAGLLVLRSSARRR